MQNNELETTGEGRGKGIICQVKGKEGETDEEWGREKNETA